MMLLRGVRRAAADVHGVVGSKAAAVAAAAAAVATRYHRRVQTRDMSDAGAHQGPMVAELWRRRQDAQSQYTDGGVDLIAKTPATSSTSITYDFADDELLRDQYRSPWNQVRMGKILEDLDALAGSIAYAHCMPAAKNLHIVTASVEKIELWGRPAIDSNLELQGQVAWVGRSSMEIRMRAFSGADPDPCIDANFVFVARELAEPGKSGGAAEINGLLPESAEEKEMFAAADAKNKAKKAHRKDIVRVNAHKEEMHANAIEVFDQSQLAFMLPALADLNTIMLPETQQHNCLVCQPQQRNTSGRVFGGFLMRRAFELAYATAYCFSGTNPAFLEVDEVLFVAPVSIGNLLSYESSVLYTEIRDGQPLMHIEVVARVMVPEERTSSTSNVFHFTFASKEGTLHRKIMPKTIEQAYRIVARQHAEKEGPQSR